MNKIKSSCIKSNQFRGRSPKPKLTVHTVQFHTPMSNATLLDHSSGYVLSVEWQALLRVQEGVLCKLQCLEERSRKVAVALTRRRPEGVYFICVSVGAMSGRVHNAHGGRHTLYLVFTRVHPVFLSSSPTTVIPLLDMRDSSTGNPLEYCMSESEKKRRKLMEVITTYLHSHYPEGELLLLYWWGSRCAMSVGVLRFCLVSLLLPPLVSSLLPFSSLSFACVLFLSPFTVYLFYDNHPLLPSFFQSPWQW